MRRPPRPGSAPHKRKPPTPPVPPVHVRPAPRLPPANASAHEVIGRAAASTQGVVNKLRDAVDVGDGKSTQAARAAAWMEGLMQQVHELKNLSRRLEPETQNMEQDSRDWLLQQEGRRVDEILGAAQRRCDLLTDELASRDHALQASEARAHDLELRLRRAERLLSETQVREDRFRLALRAASDAKLAAQSKLAACEDELAHLKLVHDELRKTATLRWPREP